MNSTPVKSQVAHLQVVIPPRIDDKKSSSDVAVPEGGAVKLHCEAEGFPKWVEYFHVLKYLLTFIKNLSWYSLSEVSDNCVYKYPLAGPNNILEKMYLEALCQIQITP